MAARIRRHVELDFVKGFLLRPPALAPAYEAVAAGDYAAAFQAYRGSANRGAAAAQNNRGIRYEVGAGVPTNSEQPESWYRRAAEPRPPLGQSNLRSPHGTSPPATHATGQRPEE